MSYLILIRHGESEYNAQGLWTGWHNPDLTEKGKLQARAAAQAIKDIHLDVGFTSTLARTKQTLVEIIQELDLDVLPSYMSEKLNERNYGIYTKKNKWEVKKEVGEEEFQKIRRSWDYPIPEGESLKQVYDRVVPYFEETILPSLKDGKNILICSSGNALRSLVKYLEHISDEDIAHVELGIGEVYKYTLDDKGEVTNKEIIAAASEKGV